MEGPGVHLLAEELAGFTGQQITDASGTTSEPIDQLVGATVTDVRAVKKRLFLDTPDTHLVFHLLLYGSYRINDPRDADEQLTLVCTADTLHLYNCSIDVLASGDPTLRDYDRPEEDVLSTAFDREQALTTLAETDRLITDVLLDQAVFGGVGNRIKNEVLWTVGVHPTTPSNSLSPDARAAIVDEAIQWAHHWLECKQTGEALNSSVYQQDECERCGTEVQKDEFGSRARGTYWCPYCQQAQT